MEANVTTEWEQLAHAIETIGLHESTEGWDVDAEACETDIANALRRGELLERALEKISRIRNIAVGTQNATWSNVMYPLVAALNEAGFAVDPQAIDAAFKGLPYGPGCEPHVSCSACGTGSTYGKLDITADSYRTCLCTCHRPANQTRFEGVVVGGPSDPQVKQ